MYGIQDIQALNNQNANFPYIGCAIVERSDGLYYAVGDKLVLFKKKAVVAEPVVEAVQ